MANKLTAEMLSKLTGLTDRRHRQLAQDGYFPSPIKGQYEFAVTIQGMFRYYREEKAKASDGLRIEQEAYTRAGRELREEELRMLRGKSIAKAEVGAALDNASVSMAAALRMIFEQEIAPKLPLLKPDEQQSLIQDGVDRVHRIFTDNMKSWLRGESRKAKQ
jgi:hypothetical protein